MSQHPLYTMNEYLFFFCSRTSLYKKVQDDRCILSEICLHFTQRVCIKLPLHIRTIVYTSEKYSCLSQKDRIGTLLSLFSCFFFTRIFVFNNKRLCLFISCVHFAKCSQSKEQKFAYFYLYENNNSLKHLRKKLFACQEFHEFLSEII